MVTIVWLRSDKFPFLSPSLPPPPFQFLSFLKSPPQCLIGFNLSRKLLFHTTIRGQLTKNTFQGTPQIYEILKKHMDVLMLKEQPKQTYSRLIITLYKSETVYVGMLKIYFFLLYSQTLNIPSFYCFFILPSGFFLVLWIKSWNNTIVTVCIYKEPLTKLYQNP